MAGGAEDESQRSKGEAGRERAAVEGPRGGADPARATSGRSAEDGPFVTVSMATLLARQGHLAEAREMLLAILERDPDDERARTLLSQIQGEEAPGEAGDADQTAKLPECDEAIGEGGGDRVGREPSRGAVIQLDLSERGLRVRWEISERLDAAGQARAGDGATRVLRVVVIRPGSPQPEREQRDREAPERQGEDILHLGEGPAVVLGAVGWLGRDGSFSPVCHAGPCRMGGRG